MEASTQASEISIVMVFDHSKHTSALITNMVLTTAAKQRVHYGGYADPETAISVLSAKAEEALQIHKERRQKYHSTNDTSEVNNRFGITEERKTELDALSTLVEEARYDVKQNEAAVACLLEKQNKLQEYLHIADTLKAQALFNKNQICELVQSAHDLQTISSIAYNEVARAKSSTEQLAQHIVHLIKSLTYTVDAINKLSDLVKEKKALNPLISDELVSAITTVNDLCENSEALTYVALKSILAAQSSIIESEKKVRIENTQAIKLLQALTGIESDNEDSVTPMSSGIPGTGNISLRALLYAADEEAKFDCVALENATNVANSDLNAANSVLNKSQIKLKSLESGFAAATAAALAS